MFVREGTFIIGGGGGWAGPSEGRVISKFLQIGEGQTCFIINGGGSQFFGQGKNYSMSLLFCIYEQSYQSRLI